MAKRFIVKPVGIGSGITSLVETSRSGRSSHVWIFFKKPLSFSQERLCTYKQTGFQLITSGIVTKQVANAIYDSGNYMDVIERDIVEAGKRYSRNCKK